MLAKLLQLAMKFAGYHDNQAGIVATSQTVKRPYDT